MHRTNIYLTDEQERALAQLAEDRQETKASIVRGLLDAALGLGDHRGHSRSSVEASFGSWEPRSDDELADLAAFRRVR